MKKTNLTQDTAERRVRRLLKKIHENRQLRSAGPRIPLGRWTVDLAMVSKRVIQELNHKHRKKNRPTDILSFPAEKRFFQAGILGSLVICKSLLREQARERSHSTGRELDVLLAHGLLHLLGFDHEKGAKQARDMAKFEEYLLGRGVAAKGLIGRSK